MKTFTKIMLRIAGILAIVGLVFVLIAFGMGLTGNRLKQMIYDNKFSIGINDGEISFFGIDLTDHEGEKEYQTDSEGRVTIEETCTKLDLEYGAGVLEIYYDDVPAISIEQKKVDGFEVTTDEDGTLYIRGALNEDGLAVNEDSATLTILIPEGMSFEEVDIEIGASQATLDGLTGDDISIMVGAGQANIHNLNCKSLNVEVGAGKANIKNLMVENLDIEAGIGKVNAEISGKESDYNYCVECGIGNVQVGKSSYGGFGAEQNITNPGAEYVMDIECGIGEVIVNFME